MNIQLQCDKIELTEFQSGYVTEKIEMLKKYYDKISDEAVMVRVHIEKNESLDQKEKIMMSVTMSVPQVVFRAEVQSLTVEEGADLLHDKLYSQIDKYKGMQKG